MVKKYIFENEFLKLTNTEKTIVEYLIANPEKFFKNTIQEIAKMAFVSTSAISRLYKKLGFSSLKEMQFYVYHEKQNWISEKKQTNNEELIEQVFLYYYQAIAETKQNLNLNSLLQVVELIIKAPKINLYGLGSSYDTALEFSHNLQKLNKQTFCSYNFHSFLLTFSINSNNQLIILFSKTGTTREILFLVDLCKKYRIAYVLVTNNKTLKNQHQHVLLYEVIEQEKRINSISSKIGQHFIIDMLLALLKNKLLNEEEYNLNNLILDLWSKFN